jgi:hypothetical protein
VTVALRDGLALSDGLEPHYPIHRRLMLTLWLILGLLLTAVIVVLVGYGKVIS